MATWNELFLDQDNIAVMPQAEVFRFVRRLEKENPGTRLRIWDQCCGGGRHSVLSARLGHETFASDIAENGVAHLRDWLRREKLTAELRVCDMTENPWGEARFHGVVCWDAIHHNSFANIRKAVDAIHSSLLPDGLFISPIMSTKACGHHRGREVEPNTFVSDTGLEAGVPHHYCDESEIRELFKAWTPVILAEQVVNYIETEKDFYLSNPFGYTRWLVLMRK